MSVANNMQIELDAVTSIAATLMGAMNEAQLSEIKTDVYEPLFNNSIAQTLQGTLPKACQTGDKKGKTISNLTKGTIEKERLADQQGQAMASGMVPQELGQSGSYNLTVDSSATDTDNDQNMKVRSDDEANKFESIMDGLDAKSYIDCMEALQNMEKEELQHYVLDPGFAPECKQWLLTSPKIDADLKQIIFDMDPLTVQANLKNLLEHQTPSTDLTRDILYNFSETSLSGEMFENMSVATVEELLSALDDYTSTDKVQNELLKVYEGKNTELSEANSSFFKSLIDTISNQSGIEQTELLTNSSYSEPLTECLQNVSQTFAYAEAVSNYSGRSVGSLLLEFTKGV